jgi:hypothetical protein
MTHTPTMVPTVRIVLFNMVVAKLPCTHALEKFSKSGESGGPRGLRPISASDFSELNLVPAELQGPAEQLVVPFVLLGVLVELREEVRVDVLIGVSGTRCHHDIWSLTTLQCRAYDAIHLLGG